MSSSSNIDMTHSTASVQQSCWFLSPQRRLVGHGAVLSSMELSGMTWQEQIATMLDLARQRGGPEIVMGAIPFWSDCPAALVLPERISELEPLEDLLAPQLQRSVPPPLPATKVSGDDRVLYEQRINKVLALIERGLVKNLVVSREVSYEAVEDIDAQTVIGRLQLCHPASYVFSVPLSNMGRSGVFLGASPELLVSRHGDDVRAIPLAGTIAAADDPSRNAQRMKTLKRSEKDRLEHEFTAQAVVRALSKFCDDVVCPTEPHVIQAGPVNHLASPIMGKIRAPDLSTIDLVTALHPTPAVGGVPQLHVQQRIRDIEGRPRGLYAGMVGWCDADGNGEWALSIRCAEIAGARATLFAGGGIVSGSVPHKEYEETETKLGTMLSALNLSPLAVQTSAIDALQALEGRYG